LEFGHQFTRKTGLLNEIKQGYLRYLKKIFSHDITRRNGTHGFFVPLLLNCCSTARQCNHWKVENTMVKIIDEGIRAVIQVVSHPVFPDGNELKTQDAYILILTG